MAKFDGLYKIETPQGKKALEQLRTMVVGEVVEFPLIPSIPQKATWKLVSHVVDNPQEVWSVQGLFCGVPFYKLEITLANNKLEMKVTE